MPTSISRTAALAVRKAAPRDLPEMVATLAAAFFDDPVSTWWIPEPERREQLLPAVFDVVVDAYHPFGELYTTDRAAAAAVWVPPGCLPAGSEAEQLLACFAEAAEETSGRMLTIAELADGHHPPERHAYLFFLATRPEWQSRGLGSALLREVLERCDRDGTPAYLEASSEANKRLYLRHGFEVTGEIRLPGGPSLWPMWREPR